jgi:hypothetical protein
MAGAPQVTIVLVARAPLRRRFTANVDFLRGKLALVDHHGSTVFAGDGWEHYWDYVVPEFQVPGSGSGSQDRPWTTNLERRTAVSNLAAKGSGNWFLSTCLLSSL